MTSFKPQVSTCSDEALFNTEFKVRYPLDYCLIQKPVTISSMWRRPSFLSNSCHLRRRKMFTKLLLPSVLTLASSASLPQARGHQNSVWQASNFKSFLTFGDSYIDESRLGYFAYHNGSAPPPGTLLPESNSTAGGGYTWPRYVARYTGDTADGDWKPSMTLYNYAVSGAVCSNYITPRYVPRYVLAPADSPEPSLQLTPTFHLYSNTKCLPSSQTNPQIALTLLNRTSSRRSPLKAPYMPCGSAPTISVSRPSLPTHRSQVKFSRIIQTVSMNPWTSYTPQGLESSFS